MRALLLALALLMAAAAHAAPAKAKPKACTFPPAAEAHLPVLVQLQREIWADAPEPWFMGGQLEQESCPALCHTKCWNPRVEFKTSREYGFGLPQITIAYKQDGSVRFNKWLELRQRYPGALKDWTWENRFDARGQMTAYMLMMRVIYGKLKGFASSVRDALGMSLSAYNGGEGAVLQDRVLCSNTPGCDKSRWFGHVEHQSYKSRVPFKGYGKSAFEINREYPHLVLDVRRKKYEPFFSKGVGRWNR